MAEPGQNWRDPSSFWARFERRRRQAEDRRRMLENLGAAVIVVLLLVAGYWLIERISAYSRNVVCIEARLKSCR